MAFDYTNIHSNNKRHNAVPPPGSGLSKQGYSTMNAISQNAFSAAWGGTGRKRAATEDEYVMMLHFVFFLSCQIFIDILMMMKKR